MTGEIADFQFGSLKMIRVTSVTHVEAHWTAGHIEDQAP